MAKADKAPAPDLTALPVEDVPTDGLKGVEAIKEAWKRLPGKPGVYRMIGEDGEVLYVGKARSLKNRVAQYAQGRGHTNRIVRMLQLVCRLEVIVTATETEALLLEVNMIKRLRPRFNVLMRDDKSFPFIAIRTDHDAPALQKHRGAKRFKGEYFGPFASANAVNRTLNTLQKAFLLRTCSDSVYSARTRPCMLHQIKRCAAPCVGLVDAAEYSALVEDARGFLRGRSDALQDRLALDMREAAEALEFERAARIRNRIRALAAVRAAQGINPQTFEDADAFAIHCEGGQTCVQVFFFRAGQNWGNRAYFPRNESGLDEAAVLESFIGQFYDGADPPALVLVNIEPENAPLLQEALSARAGRKVEIWRPERGEKKDIIDQVTLNAREALARRVADSSAVAKLLDGVAETFALKAPPERIEVYDNSHIQGTNAVGAMIVAGPDGFEKNQYRKFNIKSAEVTPGDDYAMMREVLGRRFARLARESEAAAMPPSSLRDAPPVDGGRDDAHPPPFTGEVVEQSETGGGLFKIADGGVDFSKESDAETETRAAAWPDLILIDGGEGQLKAAQDALEAAGLKGRVVLVGVAKGVDRDAGRERFFMTGRAPFRLDEKSPVLYYLQRLRDEAHRFAIGAHRQKRRADIAKNPLDEIQGVGPSRKRALLERFGSARGVARAALSELEAVEGVSTELAKRIHDFFRT
ncbi:MAG: excinuclease ABC subunit UvrC [Alphaproteobacteria bacterium]|nr:excinuclease ABC subunit UvrC [Alphaproteobacteria bacterium]